MVKETAWKERFRSVYKPLLGDRYDGFEEALRAHRSRHVRLNLLRGPDYKKELEEKCGLEALKEFKGVYRVTENPDYVADTITFQTGGAYIMNPSSLIPVLALVSYMPEEPLILDVSAAPGGKTCALSEYTGRKGLIVANEISSRRLKSLHFNLEKYGCYNVKTISMDGRLLNNIFENSFDGVLLDAPCSNENKIFRDKAVQALWSRELVSRMAELQEQLILSAYGCLKKGGVLVYSTCTMSIEENEGVVKYLLDKRPEAELLPVKGFCGGGMSGISFIDENAARVFPSPGSLDGFFAAAVRKPGELAKNIFRPPKLTESSARFFREYYTEIPEGAGVVEMEGRGYMERGSEMFPKIRFKRRGLCVYKKAGKVEEPSSQGFWEMGAKARPDRSAAIGGKEAAAFLKGFDIAPPGIYNSGLLFYRDIPVGYCKFVDGVLKNKLDRYFLYGKNIEW